MLIHVSVFVYCFNTFVHRILKLLDPARFLIFVTSLVLITHASWRAVQLDKEIKDDPASEGKQNFIQHLFSIACVDLLPVVSLHVKLHNIVCIRMY